MTHFLAQAQAGSAVILAPVFVWTALIAVLAYMKKLKLGALFLGAIWMAFASAAGWNTAGLVAQIGDALTGVIRSLTSMSL